jgi:ATP-dependent exoDNAse (exonuclease V) alpha subunit
MAGTRTLARIVDAAAAADAKLVLCGDAAQLAGVPASGAFTRLATQLDPVRLDHNVRQRDPRDAAAIASLRAERLEPDAYLAPAARRGRLQIADDAHDAIDAARRWYARASVAYGPDEVAVICRTNALRDELNTELRRHNHELHGPAVEYAGRTFQAGERIILRRNDPTTGATNGTRGRIVFINPATRALLVLTRRGALRLPAGYADEGHLQHAYALTAHNVQGATLDAACIVARPEDHSAEWAYTATSRARHSTMHVVIAGTDPDQPTRTRDVDETIHALSEALRRSDAEDERPCESVPVRDASWRISPPSLGRSSGRGLSR